MTDTLSKERRGLHTLMRATVRDQAAHHGWTYDAVRPMPVPAEWHPEDDEKGDCSKGVQYLCRWERLPDPMRRDYDPYGNSTTLCLELVHINLEEVDVGDIVTFGLNGDEHAAMVFRLIRSGSRVVDLELWSFGHQGAPDFYLLSQDGREHQLLRVRLTETQPKTPPSVLRGRVGYWAWRQWRLGKGAWYGYGRRNRNVRPDVPNIIPAAWWVRLARSLPKQRVTRANPVTARTVAASTGQAV